MRRAIGLRTLQWLGERGTGFHWCVDWLEWGLTAVLGNVGNDLHIACEELTRRGCSARITKVRYCGETEYRLLVRQPGRGVGVELLAPADEMGADCWHGVVIDRGRRTVWCGPERAVVVSGLDLVPFVADLLIRNEAVLAANYRRCDAE